MLSLFPRSRNFLHFSRRQDAAHDGRVHLVLSLAYIAVIVFHTQHKYRQRAFFSEILLGNRHRQDPIQIVLAIGGFVAMRFTFQVKTRTWL